MTIGSIAAFGQSPLAVRLPSVVAGIAYAPALFLLGRQLGGTRLGLAAGLLGAVAFWHADTTRGAWGYGAWGLACETVAVALLLRTVRRPDTGLTVLSALAFGLALQVSWAALAALGAGLLLALRALAAEEKLSSRRLGQTLGPFLVYFAVAAGPVVIGMCLPGPPARIHPPPPAEDAASPGALRRRRAPSAADVQRRRRPEPAAQPARRADARRGDGRPVRAGCRPRPGTLARRRLRARSWPG